MPPHVIKVLGLRNEIRFGPRNHESVEIAWGDSLIIEGVSQSHEDLGRAFLQRSVASEADVVDIAGSAKIYDRGGKTAACEVFWGGHVDEINSGEIEELDCAREQDANFEGRGGGHFVVFVVVVAAAAWELMDEDDLKKMLRPICK